MAASRHKPPSFFWQGLLIVLPVVVLAGVGLFSLQQDRALAQHEAVEQAQHLAEGLAQNFWTELTERRDANLPAFEVDAKGQLLFPPPAGLVPEPQSLDPVKLNVEQAELWRAAQAREQELDFASAIQACQAFLGKGPPENFAAAVLYRLGLWQAQQGNEAAAREAFEALIEKHPNAVGESGLPLGMLAQLKLIEAATRATNQSGGEAQSRVAILCSNAVFNPTAVTPLVLSKAASLAKQLGSTGVVDRCEREWQNHQLARKLYAAARPRLQPNAGRDGTAFPLLSIAGSMNTMGGPTPTRVSKPSPVFWIESGAQGEEWLATRLDGGTNGSWIFCNPDPIGVWQRLISPPGPAQNRGGVWIASFTLPPHPGLWQTNAPAPRTVEIPPYFAATVGLAGKTLISSNNLEMAVETSRGKPAGWTWGRYAGPALVGPPILAAASKVEDGIEYLRCNIHLTSPQMLFARQRQRTALFGLLIGVSAAAALVGFVTAQRAFHRQLRLAEMKSNFVSSVSHELRAPIASVRLMAEGLERGRIPDRARQQEYFRFIVQECRRLSSMIENVLDFSRIEQNRKHYEFEPTDLRALVEQTTQLMSSQAAERQIRLETVRLGEPLAAELDGRAIQQALVNLLDNALKHSPKESVIRIGLEFLAGENASGPALEASEVSMLHLWVEDTGEGIPPEEQTRIFERFYRCGSELRRETQGVGIGLSIVKHIVEGHRGRVLVRSALGQGSRFTLELPVKAMAAQNR